MSIGYFILRSIKKDNSYKIARRVTLKPRRLQTHLKNPQAGLVAADGIARLRGII